MLARILVVFGALVLLQGCDKKNDSNPKTTTPVGAKVEDPEGVSRRPPSSMHAHQDKWEAACQPGMGKVQSPIILTTTNMAKYPESPIRFSKMPNVKAELLDVGHTFQVRYLADSVGAIAEFEGQKFSLRQFHFHKPSEHILDGKQYEMEGHFVFLNQDKNATPKALVLGVMIIEGPTNVELQKIWKFLPPMKEGYGETDEELSDWDEIVTSHELEVESLGHHEKVLASGIEFDLYGLLPEKSDFIIYNGSLTTPGCAEEITHAVSLTPIHVDHEQGEHFEGYYEGSNRDIQPIGDLGARNFRRSSP